MASSIWSLSYTTSWDTNLEFRAGKWVGEYLAMEGDIKKLGAGSAEFGVRDF